MTLYKNLLDRPEPQGNWWNTLGSASLFLFVLQGVTGIFLTVYYTPSPDHAYDSIQYIMQGVAFGWLIRGIHHWGASLMVLVVFIHMLRVFVTASYKYPRELTWFDRRWPAACHHWHGLHRLSAALEPEEPTGRPRSARRSQARFPWSATSSSRSCAVDRT